MSRIQLTEAQWAFTQPPMSIVLSTAQYPSPQDSVSEPWWRPHRVRLSCVVAHILWG